MRSRSGRWWLRAGVAVAVAAAALGARAGGEDPPAGGAPAGSQAAAPPPGAPPSSQPFTLGAAANLFLPSAGVDLSWQAHDRLALGLQATTLVVHLDLSLRTRLYLAPGARGGGFYLGANGHLWWSPLLMTGLAPAATGELGWEWRGPTGVLVGVGAGGGRIRVPRGSGGAANPEHWEWIPLLDVRVAFPLGRAAVPQRAP